MKSKLLFDAIGDIYDCFINEDAQDVAAIKNDETSRPTRVSPKMKVAIPAAACLCAVALGAYAIISRRSALSVNAKALN